MKLLKNAGKHDIKTIEIVEKEGVELLDEVVQLIKVHNYEKNGAKAPEILMD